MTREDGEQRLLDREALLTPRAVMLVGYRDVPAARVDAIAEVLVELSDMIGLVPEIEELDINPLLTDAEGVIALDARVILAPR